MKKVLWRIIKILTVLAGVAGFVVAYVYASTEDYLAYINSRGIIDPDVITNTTPLLVTTFILLGVSLLGIFVIERRNSK